MSCPLKTIDLQHPSFHAVTNCFFRKPFVLMNICVAPVFLGQPPFLPSPTKHRHPGKPQRQGTFFPRLTFATFRNPCYLPHRQGDFLSIRRGSASRQSAATRELVSRSSRYLGGSMSVNKATIRRGSESRQSAATRDLVSLRPICAGRTHVC